MLDDLDQWARRQDEKVPSPAQNGPVEAAEKSAAPPLARTPEAIQDANSGQRDMAHGPGQAPVASVDRAADQERAAEDLRAAFEDSRLASAEAEDRQRPADQLLAAFAESGQPRLAPEPKDQGADQDQAGAPQSSSLLGEFLNIPSHVTRDIFDNSRDPAVRDAFEEAPPPPSNGDILIRPPGAEEFLPAEEAFYDDSAAFEEFPDEFRDRGPSQDL
jgi:hypothetical protein